MTSAWPMDYIDRAVDAQLDNFTHLERGTRCDFCSVEPALWTYDCESFDFPGIKWGSTGGWGACPICHDLIEDERWPVMTARSIKAYELIHHTPMREHEVIVKALNVMHEGFRYNRHATPSYIEPGMKKQAEQLTAEQARDPVIVARKAKLDAYTRSLVTPHPYATHYQTAIDTQLNLLRFLDTATAVEVTETQVQNGLSLYGTKPDRARIVRAAEQVRAVTRLILSCAEPFFWNSEMCELLEHAAAGIPDTWTLTPQMLPTTMGFMYFARPIRITGGDPLIGLCWGDAIRADASVPVPFITYTGPHPEGIRVTYFVEDIEINPSGVPQGATDWKFGQSIGDQMFFGRNEVTDDGPWPFVAVANEARFKAKLSVIACALALMDQKLLAHSHGHLDRATAKRASKLERPPADVKVVYLRKSYQPTGAAPTGEGQAREWTCQWVSRWHWRNQPYKGGIYKTILIPASIKGPKDKPLRNPERLFAVVR